MRNDGRMHKGGRGSNQYQKRGSSARSTKAPGPVLGGPNFDPVMLGTIRKMSGMADMMLHTVSRGAHLLGPLGWPISREIDPMMHSLDEFIEDYDQHNEPGE